MHAGRHRQTTAALLRPVLALGHRSRRHTPLDFVRIKGFIERFSDLLQMDRRRSCAGAGVVRPLSQASTTAAAPYLHHSRRFHTSLISSFLYRIRLPAVHRCTAVDPGIAPRQGRYRHISAGHPLFMKYRGVFTVGMLDGEIGQLLNLVGAQACLTPFLFLNP
jgi:hypothetical protein